MRLRYNATATPYLHEEQFYFINKVSEKNYNWLKIFKIEQPLIIEIGMGKGNFIYQKALQNPQNNYLGIEKFDTVLAKAVKRFHTKEQLENLKVISFDASDLLTIFEANTITKIYLNFSDPWPKVRHAKRRLTHPNFLTIYQKILKPDGVIQFKTDNDGLFQYTLDDVLLANLNKYKIIYQTDDLYKNIDDCENHKNIPTEYETKFHELDKNINKIIFGFK